MEPSRPATASIAPGQQWPRPHHTIPHQAKPVHATRQHGSSRGRPRHSKQNNSPASPPPSTNTQRHWQQCRTRDCANHSHAQARGQRAVQVSRGAGASAKCNTPMPQRAAGILPVRQPASAIGVPRLGRPPVCPPHRAALRRQQAAVGHKEGPTQPAASQG